MSSFDFDYAKRAHQANARLVRRRFKIRNAIECLINILDETKNTESDLDVEDFIAVYGKSLDSETGCSDDAEI